MSRIGSELVEIVVSEDDVSNDAVSILDEEVGDGSSVGDEGGSDGSIGSVDGDGSEGCSD